MSDEIVTVGLVGYPNVGKSSTINTLLENKKVSVSSTPGKTKHFQVYNIYYSISHFVNLIKTIPLKFYLDANLSITQNMKLQFYLVFLLFLGISYFSFIVTYFKVLVNG